MIVIIHELRIIAKDDILFAIKSHSEIGQLKNSNTANIYCVVHMVKLKVI